LRLPFAEVAGATGNGAGNGRLKVGKGSESEGLMPQSYLIFDFKTDEQAAQQARHRVEAWRQAFRLGKKLELKFERKPAETAGASASGEEKAGAEEAKADAEEFRLLVRLDFSDHERLSHHRWLDRIPAEEPFKSAGKEVVRHGEERFAATRELFDSLK
jgi:hypothetical protein